RAARLAVEGGRSKRSIDDRMAKVAVAGDITRVRPACADGPTPGGTRPGGKHQPFGRRTHMASETKQITIRELWTQMRGIENAFRFYSDVLNGVAYSSPRSYDSTISVDDQTYTTLTSAYEQDCVNPPWCTIM